MPDRTKARDKIYAPDGKVRKIAWVAEFSCRVFVNDNVDRQCVHVRATKAIDPIEIVYSDFYKRERILALQTAQVRARLNA